MKTLNWKKSIPAAALLFAAGAVLAACSAPAAKELPVQPATATPAPSLAAISADGVAKLIADAKGKVVVLNFWATWCPPCVAEMPDIVKFYNETKREQVVFISLCANDPAELRTKVAAFQKEKALPFPVYLLNDPGQVEALAKATRSTLSGGLPTTLIYDKESALKATWERDTNFNELMETVKPLL